MNDYPEVLILGRDTCEDTIRSREHLERLGVPYVYRSVEIDPDADAWNRSYNGGNRVTPVILVGDPNHPTAVLIEPSDAILEQTVTGA